MTQTSVSPSELESYGPETAESEVLPTGEQIVEKSLGDIHAIETQVVKELQLEPGSLEAAEATTQALAHIAESTLESPHATEAEKADVMDDVAIETAIEIEHDIDPSKTPVTILELDGYGEDVTAVVARLHETHATLPSSHEAAPLVMAAIEGHAEISNLDGNVEYSPPHPEKRAEPERFSDEQILEDARERMLTPNQLRRGSEIVNQQTGEILKPSFELTIEAEDGQLILDKIAERRAAVSRADEILTQIESGQVETDLKDLKIPALHDILGQISSVKYESEGKFVGGTLVDIYMTPEDVAAIVAIGARLDSLPIAYKLTSTRSERYGLTEEALAQNVIDYSEQLIPEGTPLIHTLDSKKLFNVLADGALKTRFQLDPSSGDKLTHNGSHTQYVHFAEPGKINPYGDTAIAIPIEEIIARSPYHQAESYKHADWNQQNTQEKMGRVSVSRENAPLALQKRIAVLRERFERGLIAKATQGDTNNIAFAASSEKFSAARYDYSLDKATILIEPNRIGEKEEAFLKETSNKDRTWLDEHSLPFLTDARSLHAQMNIESITDIKLPSPASLTDESGPIVAYGPVAQNRVDFDEAATGRSVNLAKAYKDKYSEFMEEQSYPRNPRQPVPAEPVVWSGGPPIDGDF